MIGNATAISRSILERLANDSSHEAAAYIRLTIEQITRRRYSQVSCGQMPRRPQETCE
jgi:hypothetical protein